MKKNLFSLGALGMIALFAACTQAPKGYTVEGTLSDSTMNGETIYINDADKGIIVDSTVVNGNTFVFEGKVDTPSLASITTRDMVALFALENGKVVIDGEGNSSGTPLNDELTRVTTQMENLNKEYSNAYQLFGGSREEWNVVHEKEWVPRFKQLVTDAYPAHANDVVGYVVARLYMTRVLGADEQLKLINTFGPWLSSTQYISTMKEALEAQQKTAVGQPYIDITGTDAEGNAVSLSDYVGKGNYVLVDMWASWCGPCRREIPNLANVYNLYKDKGLTVLGIYVWDKMENFAPALEAEKITWPQIIDSNETATKLYGVRGIPCIMLIGPDGTILDRTNLRGDNMQPTVEKFMFEK